MIMIDRYNTDTTKPKHRCMHYIVIFDSNIITKIYITYHTFWLSYVVIGVVCVQLLPQNDSPINKYELIEKIMMQWLEHYETSSKVQIKLVFKHEKANISLSWFIEHTPDYQRLSQPRSN